MSDTETNMGNEHGGHRRRMMERLQNGELRPHEYLEILLFSALPRRNTSDIAHRLLSEFGSVEKVLSAPMDCLQEVDGVGESVAGFLHTIGIVLDKYYEAKICRYPSSFRYDTFLSFLKKDYEGMEREVLDIYAVNEAGEITGRWRHDSPSNQTMNINPKWINAFFCENDPTGIIIVHTHPVGEAGPSSMDDKATLHFHNLCAEYGVTFCDHFIYSPKGVYSYGLNGKMKNIYDTYQQKTRDWLYGFIQGANDE